VVFALSRACSSASTLRLTVLEFCIIIVLFRSQNILDLLRTKSSGKPIRTVPSIAGPSFNTLMEPSKARKDTTTTLIMRAAHRLALDTASFRVCIRFSFVLPLSASRFELVYLARAGDAHGFFHGEVFGKEAGIAEARQHAGEISLADKSQIEIAAERLELDATSAVADARNARIALETVLGVKQPQGTLQLSDSLEPLAEITAEELLEIVAALREEWLIEIQGVA